MSLAAYVAEDGLVGHHWEERSCKLYMPQYRGTPGARSRCGWVGEPGGVRGEVVYGTFGIAFEM